MINKPDAYSTIARQLHVRRVAGEMSFNKFTACSNFIAARAELIEMMTQEFDIESTVDQIINMAHLTSVERRMENFWVAITADGRMLGKAKTDFTHDQMVVWAADRRRKATILNDLPLADALAMAEAWESANDRFAHQKESCIAERKETLHILKRGGRFFWVDVQKGPSVTSKPMCVAALSAADAVARTRASSMYQDACCITAEPVKTIA